MTTGNYVADYQIVVVACDRCKGRQYIIPFDHLELNDIIKGMRFAWKRATVKFYKTNGYLPCPDCNGKGTREVIR
jgi:hypothetical protein